MARHIIIGLVSWVGLNVAFLYVWCKAKSSQKDDYERLGEFMGSDGLPHYYNSSGGRGGR